MATRYDAAERIKKRVGPFEICAELGVDMNALLRMLKQLVGERELSYSEILFSIPERDRQQKLRCSRDWVGRTAAN
jgi:hypothetical protein